MVNIAIVDTNIRNYEQLISYIEPNTIIETIPDIESMRDWSAYYLFEAV